MPSQSRRRLDRILDPGYLTDVDGLSASQLRSRRDECREEEAAISFYRRLIHGKLDIIRSELGRRGGTVSDQGDMTQRIVDALGEGMASGRRRSRPRVLAAKLQAAGRRRLERLVEADTLARLPDMAESEIRKLESRLQTEEQSVSQQRRRLLDVMDALDEALVSRYQGGEASAGELLHRHSQNPG